MLDFTIIVVTVAVTVPEGEAAVEGPSTIVDDSVAVTVTAAEAAVEGAPTIVDDCAVTSQ